MADFNVARTKRPAEKWRIEYDFADDVEEGDTYASKAITATKESDGTDVTATLLEGETNTAVKLKVRVKGGEDGIDYVVRFQLTTAAGDIFARTVKVQVRA